jgi:4-diphosphocytidyl-2C-methyl-D-erythritol kinase
MSGSGSTIFGLFAEESQAAAAAEVLRNCCDWRLIIAKPLVRTAS